MRYIWLLVLMVAIAGCAGTPEETTNQIEEPSEPEHGEMVQNDEMEESEEMEDPIMENQDAMETTLEGAFYEPFTQQRYEEAKKSGKTILVEFYANWCPKCAKQQPNIEAAFEEIADSDIVGFRVNFKDSETDDDEVEMARKFGITYQHSHVIIDSEENVLVKEIATQWSKDDTINKLTEAKGV